MISDEFDFDVQLCCLVLLLRIGCLLLRTATEIVNFYTEAYTYLSLSFFPSDRHIHICLYHSFLLTGIYIFVFIILPF